MQENNRRVVAIDIKEKNYDYYKDIITKAFNTRPHFSDSYDDLPITNYTDVVLFNNNMGCDKNTYFIFKKCSRNKIKVWVIIKDKFVEVTCVRIVNRFTKGINFALLITEKTKKKKTRELKAKGLDYIFTYGKYKGMTVADIIKIDKQYIEYFMYYAHDKHYYTDEVTKLL